MTKRNLAEIEVRVVEQANGLRKIERSLKKLTRPAEKLEDSLNKAGKATRGLERNNRRLSRSMDRVQRSVRRIQDRARDLQRRFAQMTLRRLRASVDRTRAAFERMGRAARGALDGIKRRSGIAVRSIGRIGKALGGIGRSFAGGLAGGLFAGGLAGILAPGAILSQLDAVAQRIDDINKRALRIDVNPQFYELLTFMADFKGIDQTKVDEGTRQFSRRFASFKGGDENVFKGAPDAVLSALRGAEGVDDALAIVSDALSGIEDDVARLNLSKKLLGEEGAVFIGDLLTNTTEELEKFKSDLERLLPPLTATLRTQAAEFQDSQTRMQKAVEGVRREVFSRFADRLTEFQNTIALKGIADNRSAIADRIEGFMNRVFDAVERVNWQEVGAGIETIANATLRLAEALAKALAAIGKIPGLLESADNKFQSGLSAIGFTERDRLASTISNRAKRGNAVTDNLKDNFAFGDIREARQLLEQLPVEVARGFLDGLPDDQFSQQEIVSQLNELIAATIKAGGGNKSPLPTLPSSINAPLTQAVERNTAALEQQAQDVRSSSEAPNKKLQEALTRSLGGASGEGFNGSQSPIEQAGTKLANAIEAQAAKLTNMPLPTLPSAIGSPRVSGVTSGDRANQAARQKIRDADVAAKADVSAFQAAMDRLAARAETTSGALARLEANAVAIANRQPVQKLKPLPNITPIDVPEFGFKNIEQLNAAAQNIEESGAAAGSSFGAQAAMAALGITQAGTDAGNAIPGPMQQQAQPIGGAVGLAFTSSAQAGAAPIGGAIGQAFGGAVNPEGIGGRIANGFNANVKLPSPAPSAGRSRSTTAPNVGTDAP